MADKRLVVGYPDDVILRAVHRYHYLTAEQVRRLRYGPGVITYVRARLKRLADAGYLQRRFIPRTSPRGKDRSIFRLGSDGMHYLEAVGVEVDRRIVRPSEGKHDYLHLAHTEAVNDFLISLELLCRAAPSVAIREIIHERVLKQRPIYVEDEAGQRQPVVPDSWIHLDEGGYQMCVVLELDRGTEEQKKWRRKVAGYLKAVRSGAYEQQFGTPLITLAVVTTAGDRRIGHLRRWTEAELDARGEVAEADMFRFTSLDPAQVPPEELFLQPRWLAPFSSSALIFLEDV